MSQVKRLPKRNEIPDELKWKLEDIYPSQEEWEKDYQWVKEALPKTEEVKGTLGRSAQDLLKGLDFDIQLSGKIEKLYSYAHMKKDEDNSNTDAQALLDRAQALYVEYSSAVSFYIPEILAIPEEKLEEFLSAEEGLEVYRHFLHDINRKRAHVLSPSEEQILAMAGELASAPRTIFTMLNNADLRFPNIRDENGEEIELTKGRYIQFMESRDRRVRKEAFKTLYETYGKHKNTIASTLNASIKKDVFFSRVRKYGSTREAALKENNIPLSVYDNLIDTIGRNFEPFYEYVSLRKKALGLDELHMYDLYVPIVKDIEMKVPYDRAKEMVAEGLKLLGENYQAILREGYESGWIDVMENQGKTSGAYSWGTYFAHPYVLLNYQDNIDNVFTLAHEMGHAIHTYLSNKNQHYVNADYKIFVAEVASTLNEILLTEHLLETLEDPKEKAYILNHYLEQFRGTVYRQTMFAEFEMIVHNMAETGQPLTCESMSKVYKELNEKYFGPEMVIDDEIALEWMRIPHFYRSFYVYQYATGFCAAAALANRIRTEGEPAVKRYLDFLSGGGSDYPINLLKKAGVDMTSSEPVQTALDNFAEMVRRMENLLLD
jgi:oligoendopeptidase F